jgi:hypothetical protein
MTPPDHALTCYLDLPGGRRVEVGMTVYAEPLIPTPNEPDIEREPRLDEWGEICAKLATLQISSIRSKTA